MLIGVKDSQSDLEKHYKTFCGLYIYREVWIGLGGTHSAVYATEVSEEEYAIYTTEESEKLELQKLTEELDGNLQLAVRQLANRRKAARNSNLLNQDNHE